MNSLLEKEAMAGQEALAAPAGSDHPGKASDPAHHEHTALSPDLTLNVTPLMIFFSIWIGLSGWVLNFDIGYSGTVLRMEPFNRAFGHCAMVPAQAPPGAHHGHRALVEVCRLSATAQSVGSSIYILFMAVGAALSGFTSHYLGRRGAIQVGCLVVIIGAAGMLGSSGNYTAYVCTKCLGAVGVGHLQATAPIYGVETTPARRRGFLVALFSIGAGLGNLTVALVCLGSSGITNDWSWKTPIICQIPVAVIYGAGLQFFPESPRWLITKGKVDQARLSFARFYNKDAQCQEISAQVQEVQAAIDAETAIAATTSWTEIFGRRTIRRTLTAIAIPVGASLSGAFAIFTYAAIFLTGLGIKNPYLTNVYMNICTLAGACIGPFLIEFLGRRRTILTGYSGMATCILIFSTVASGMGTTDPVVEKVLVAFLCLWVFVFGACIASSMWITSAEMHPVRLRTYGQAAAIGINNTFQFACSFWTPYMININYGNWGTNVGYFYFATEVAALIVMFFIVPETARLTLEQIDNFFESSRKAWRTSLAENKRTAKRDTYASAF